MRCRASQETAPKKRRGGAALVPRAPGVSAPDVGVVPPDGWGRLAKREVVGEDPRDTDQGLVALRLGRGGVP